MVQPEEARPPPAQQTAPPDGWWPHSIQEIVEPWALDEIRCWLSRCARWHKDGGSPSQRPEARAYGQDAIQPRARGRLWDLRGGPGNVRLWQPYTAAEKQARTCVDLDFAAELFGDCADEEFVDFLLHGVRFGADLAHQIVLQPNLLSLYREGGIDAAAAQMDDMVRAGFIAVFDDLPSVPYRVTPRGVVPKAGTDELRGIGDQGAPRKPLRTERSGELVEALNAKCRDADWSHEDKDGLQHAAHNGAVLQAFGDMLQEFVFSIALDMSCLLYTSPSPRDRQKSRMPSSA